MTVGGGGDCNWSLKLEYFGGEGCGLDLGKSVAVLIGLRRNSTFSYLRSNHGRVNTHTVQHLCVFNGVYVYQCNTVIEFIQNRPA